MIWNRALDRLVPMRTALLAFATMLLACLLAARPAIPTHAELVDKVNALEARVAALEASIPKPVPTVAKAIRDGRIVLGMTEAEVRLSFGNSGQSFKSQRIIEGPLGTHKTWALNYNEPLDPSRQAAAVEFQDGVVVRVER